MDGSKPLAWILPLVCSTTLLLALDPSWKSKQFPQWDQADVKQILSDSPWAKTFEAVLLPTLTPAQRQEGGSVAEGNGLDLKALEGITLTGINGAAEGREKSKASANLHAVTIRWESALPIRVAELKASESGASDWQEAEYAVGVYQVPGLKNDSKSLRGELKKVAALRRERKKDLRPTHVGILKQTNDDATVFYFFSRSDELTDEDIRVAFVAQIGRLFVSRYFYVQEMHFQGKLQL